VKGLGDIVREMRLRTAVLSVIAAAWPLFAIAQPPPTYEAARAAALKSCEAIDATAYQSGLALNPDGYRSFYLRSECLQRTAVRFRDPASCDRVVRRRALLSSSWGYSPQNCRTLVDRGFEVDRLEVAELRQRYLSSAMVLRDVVVLRNGNGRDYDIKPVFAGASGTGYIITVEITAPDGRWIPIHTNGYYADPRSELTLFIRREEIAARVPAFEAGRAYQVRVTTTYSLPAPSDARVMSEAFLETAFPRRERERTITRTVRF
jgi:hypothetical protein